MLTREVTQLTQDAADDRWPSWSPDGGQVVFVSDRSGNDDLYVMDASGENVVQLTTDAAMDRYPAWSPDGSRIAFAREDVNGSSLLLLDAACISDPDNCEDSLTPVTVNRYDLHPAWSPDGDRIAFAASDFPGLPWVIAVFDLESGTYSPLPGTGSSDHLPAWSPDGSQIGFSSSLEGAPDVWLMTDTGEVECQLTFNPANDVEVAWSPDGEYLVFASDRGEQGDFELYLIRADCNAPEGVPEADLIQLTDNDADDFNPDWLP
ncbi:MAG: DPP IV N-terminal domain-containing protein [Chloroflexota bacterium]